MTVIWDASHGLKESCQGFIFSPLIKPKDRRYNNTLTLSPLVDFLGVKMSYYSVLFNYEGELGMEIQIFLMLVKNFQRPISGVYDVFIDILLQFN